MAAVGRQAPGICLLLRARRWLICGAAAEAVMGVPHAVRASPYSSCDARGHDQSSSAAQPARHSATARAASDAAPAATAGSGGSSAARHSVDPAAATETSANVLSRHCADRAADCANAENAAEPAHAVQA